MLRFLFYILTVLTILVYHVQKAHSQNPISKEIRILYSFDSCATDSSQNIADQRPSGENGLVVGNKICEPCGVNNTSMYFDGNTSIVAGETSSRFPNTGPFGISFYMKPDMSSETYEIFSKTKASCEQDTIMITTYNPVTRLVTFRMKYGPVEIQLRGRTTEGKCWHHIAITRRSQEHFLYIDGELADDAQSSFTINSENDNFEFGNGPCSRSNGDISGFRGSLDEIYLFLDFLTPQDIRQLSVPINYININSRLQRIFQGDSVSFDIQSSCIDQLVWTPDEGVSQSTDGFRTVIKPPTIGEQTYVLEMIDQNGCSTIDTLLFSVLDAAELDCRQLAIPNAFTPNGDGLNDRFGIVNARAISELVDFKIFDRRGTLLWETSDLNDQWDGYFLGSPLPPETYFYKIRYRCDNSLETYNGNVFILR